MRKKFFWFAFAFLTFTQLTACASRLYVSSAPPQAKVELLSSQDRSATELGETPLKISKDELSRKQLRGPYLIRISKEGLISKEILVTTLSGLDIDINVELTASSSSAKLNELVNELFDAQNLVQKGNQAAALEKLSQLQKAHPDVSAIYEMKGSVMMVRGDFGSAVKEFQTALNIDPQNRDLRVLLESAQARKNRGQ